MKTIFTAIFGPYDDLKEPNVITPGWAYICFTDQPLQSKVWKIIQRPMLPEGGQRTARFYKIMFHRHIETEFSIWIDASFVINCNLDQWWKQFKEPVTCIRHPWRNCVYKEADECIKQNRGNVFDIRKQVLNYHNIALPDQHGLIQSGIVMRKLCQPAIDLCDIWYQQLQLYSVRDQLAFAYAAWRMPVHHLIDWDYTAGKEFIFVRHLHKRKQTI